MEEIKCQHREIDKARDYHQGIIDCHVLFDELKLKHLPHDDILVDVFFRLVFYDLGKMENPAQYYAEQQLKKTYQQAIEECCSMVKRHLDYMYNIDNAADVRGITFDFIETINRALVCYLFDCPEGKKEELRPEDISAMQLPFSDFDYLRIKNAKNVDSCFNELPKKYLYAYVDKDDDWKMYRYNVGLGDI